ncbi:MAG: HupE/UreJ family protein [Myxococcales bacterium]|nr:HupE/UreJ family protein [Myxococcales bacterium]
MRIHDRTGLAPGARGGSRRVRAAVAALGLWVLLLGVRPVQAHSRTSSFSTIDIASTDVRWRLRVRAVDLLAPLGLPEAGGQREIAQRLAPLLPDARTYVRARVFVSSGPKRCPMVSADAPRLAPAETEAATEVILGFVFRCPDPGPLTLRQTLFFDLDPLHTGFAQVNLAGASSLAEVFRADHQELRVAQSGPARRLPGQVFRFWILGVEHIFTGYDHLAFLGGLLLVTALAARSRGASPAVVMPLRSALLATAKIVTAFTLAHSLTLVVAALWPPLVPTRFVEPIIALSVAIVGLENLLPRLPRHRAVLAFAFGLIHGFGFASVLQEVGLPREGFLAALVAFNVGVESGQLVVVAVVLPALVTLAHRRPRLYERGLLPLGSAALVVAGLWWLMQRL